MADHRALVITEPGVITLQDVPALVPGPGEVVARPAYVGVCGTDLELLDGVVDPGYVRYPLVPGHEWSGLIEAVGPGVTALTPGQPVIAEGIIPDRTCAQCARGNTNLCLTYDEIGFTRAGAAADQLLLPAQVVHPLPPGADLAEAALAEPAAVAWRGISRVRPRPGERAPRLGRPRPRPARDGAARGAPSLARRWPGGGSRPPRRRGRGPGPVTARSARSPRPG